MAAALITGVYYLPSAINAKEPVSAIGFTSVAAALEALRADPDARESHQISQQGAWIIVERHKNGRFELWTFTTDGHPAHPTAVRRTPYQKDGAWYITMSALCQSDKASCDTLMEQFQQLNEDMARRLGARDL